MKSRRCLRFLLEGVERIRSAAIKMADGTVLEGPMHIVIIEFAADNGYFSDIGVHSFDELKAAFEGYDPDELGVEEGFTTSSGRFVDREEAFDIANSRGQIKPSRRDSVIPGHLDSSDVRSVAA